MIFKILEDEENKANYLLNKIKPKNIEELEDVLPSILDCTKPNIPMRVLLNKKHYSMSCNKTLKFDGVCLTDQEPFEEYIEYEIIVEFDLNNKTTITSKKKNIAIDNISIYFEPNLSTFETTIDYENGE